MWCVVALLSMTVGAADFREEIMRLEADQVVEQTLAYIRTGSHGTAYFRQLYGRSYLDHSMADQNRFHVYLFRSLISDADWSGLRITDRFDLLETGLSLPIASPSLQRELMFLALSRRELDVLGLLETHVNALPNMNWVGEKSQLYILPRPMRWMLRWTEFGDLLKSDEPLEARDVHALTRRWLAWHYPEPERLVRAVSVETRPSTRFAIRRLIEEYEYGESFDTFANYKYQTEVVNFCEEYLRSKR